MAKPWSTVPTINFDAITPTGKLIGRHQAIVNIGLFMVVVWV